MKGIGIVTAVCIASVALAGAVQADDESAGSRHERMAALEEEMFDNVAAELHLTPEQQQKLLQNRQAHKTAAAGVREKMRASRLAIKQELEKDTPDRARLQQLNGEMKGHVGAMMDQRLEGMLSTKEILTPEQFRKLSEKIESHRGKRGSFREQLRRFRENRSGADPADQPSSAR